MRVPGNSSSVVFRFADVEVCESDFSVSRAGLRLALEPKALKVLLYLLHHPGRLVRKDELLDAVWGAIAVTEDSLIRTIGLLRRLLGDDHHAPRFIETVATIGYRFICPVTEVVHEFRQEVMSIAVLPLEDLSHEPGHEYFADGMTDALIASLTKIRALRVISRKTAMRLKETSKTLPEIARELDIDALVEGSVSRYDNRVRVSANLVHALTDRQLWSGSYEAEWKDVLTVQGQLARAIAEEVKVELTPEEHARLTSAPRRNPEAYQAYLKATYARKRSVGGLVAGIQNFREAIALDSGYADAHLGLALSYLQIGFGYGPMSSSEAFRESRQAAREAFRLDPMLAEAASCEGWVKAFGDWNWPGAEENFRHALEINSRSAEAHRLYAWYLSAMCRHDEAIWHATVASQLEPDSLAAAYAVGATCWWAHRFSEVAGVVEKLEQMDPTFPGGPRLHGAVCLHAGLYEEAIRQHQRELDLCGGDFHPFGVTYLGCALSLAGRSAEAHAVLNNLESAAREQYISPYLLATLQISMGEIESAFDYLEKGCRERATMLAFIRSDFYFDPIRGDARYKDLLRRMKFPE